MSLPTPSQDQAFCHVSAVEAGHIKLSDEMFITGAIPGAVTVAPSLSFLITHATSSKRFLFDLGIRKDWHNYPPKTIHWIENGLRVHVPQDVIDSLAKGGLKPNDIDTVCLSHCHYDHVGDPSAFDKSTFVVGADSTVLFKPGYPADINSHYPSDLLPWDRTKLLSPNDWLPLGPFPHALDFYGDGSLYIIDAPGHAPGHINLLVRSSADGGWIFLAGDSAHNWKLVTGEAQISVGHPGWMAGQAHGCAHFNKDWAEEHLSHIRAIREMPRVQLLLAHDARWYLENKGGSGFFPGKIPSL